MALGPFDVFAWLVVATLVGYAAYILQKVLKGVRWKVKAADPEAAKLYLKIMDPEEKERHIK